jgi:hypothetical protein
MGDFGIPPIFEKFSHLPEKGGALVLLKTTLYL